MSELIIIGGTAGIGRALAAHYLARGRSVVIAGRDADRARSAAADLAAGGATPGRVRGVAADLRRPESLAAAFADLERVSGVVVAGVERDNNTLAAYDVARAVQLATVKVVGYTAAVGVLAPRLEADASVLLFGGLAKDNPYPGSTTVTAVNAAITGVVRTLSVELAPHRVNSIHPGLVSDSEAWADDPALLAADRRAALAGRLPTIADVVGGCAFLLDNPAANGIDLMLHGGRR